MSTLGLCSFLSFFPHLTVATRWAFSHSQTMPRPWDCRCMHGPWPRPAEPDPGQQGFSDGPRPKRHPEFVPCAALAVLSHWKPSGIFSAYGMRTCFLHPSPSFLIIHPPLPCAHRACSKPCCTFAPRRRVATIPEMMSVKCHMFQEERRSPEGT